MNMLIEKKVISPQDYDEIFTDYGHIKTFLNGQPNIFNEWNESKALIQQRWMEVFAKLKSNGISYNKFAKIIEFAMMLPGTIEEYYIQL